MRFSDDIEDSVEAQLMREIEGLDMAQSMALSVQTDKSEDEFRAPKLISNPEIEVFEDIFKELQIQTGKLHKVAGTKLKNKLHQSYLRPISKQQYIGIIGRSALLKGKEEIVVNKSSFLRFKHELKVPKNEKKVKKIVEAKSLDSNQMIESVVRDEPILCLRDSLLETMVMHREDKLSRKYLGIEKLMTKVISVYEHSNESQIKRGFKHLHKFRHAHRCYLAPVKSYKELELETTRQDKLTLFKQKLNLANVSPDVKVIQSESSAVVTIKKIDSNKHGKSLEFYGSVEIVQPHKSDLTPLGLKFTRHESMFLQKNKCLNKLIMAHHAPVLLEELRGLQIDQIDSKLKRLIVSNQKINTEVYANELQMFQLYELKNIGLKEVDECFSNAVEIIASHNSITSFNKPFSSLCTLDLSYNSLKYVSLGQPSWLMHLDISYNQVTDIQDVLANCPRLRSLKAKSNFISYVKFTHSNRDIQVLDLSNNGLEYVEGLEHLTELRYLNLSGNPNLILKRNVFVLPLVEEVYIELRKNYFHFNELVLVSFNKNFVKFASKQLQYDSRIKIVNKSSEFNDYYTADLKSKDSIMQKLLLDRLANSRLGVLSRGNSDEFKPNMKSGGYLDIVERLNKGMFDANLNSALWLTGVKNNYEKQLQSLIRVLGNKLSKFSLKARLSKLERLVSRLQICIASRSLFENMGSIVISSKVVRIQKLFRGFYTRKRLKKLMGANIHADDLYDDDIASISDDFMSLPEELNNFDSFYKTSQKFVEPVEKEEAKALKSHKNFVIKSKPSIRVIENCENTSPNYEANQLAQEWGLKQQDTIQALFNKYKKDHKRRKNVNFRIVNLKI